MTGIPRPLVRANQATLVAGVVLAAILRQPVVLAALLALMLAGLLLGPRRHPVFVAARLLLARRLAAAPGEDPAAQRFNQTIAVTLLAGAQLAFLLGWPAVGWILAGAVAGAATLALSGFCVGCWLYPRIRALRFRYGL